MANEKLGEKKLSLSLRKKIKNKKKKVDLDKDGMWIGCLLVCPHFFKRQPNSPITIS